MGKQIQSVQYWSYHTFKLTLTYVLLVDTSDPQCKPPPNSHVQNTLLTVTCTLITDREYIYSHFQFI
jgi:hypothetical protein